MSSLWECVWVCPCKWASACLLCHSGTQRHACVYKEMRNETKENRKGKKNARLCCLIESREEEREGEGESRYLDTDNHFWYNEKKEERQGVCLADEKPLQMKSFHRTLISLVEYLICYIIFLLMFPFSVSRFMFSSSSSSCRLTGKHRNVKLCAFVDWCSRRERRSPVGTTIPGRGISGGWPPSKLHSQHEVQRLVYTHREDYFVHERKHETI